MRVYLLRHGIAEEASTAVPDAERALTAEGKRKLKRALSWLAAGETRIDLILSSPLKRALQTAEIARSCFKVADEILPSKALQPNGSPHDAWEEIRIHNDIEHLLLVGHNPLFGDLAAYLLRSESLSVDFKKGAVMCIGFESIGQKPRGTLEWYVPAGLAGSGE